MTTYAFNVLFLCVGNSARSIMAEALLNHTGHGKFNGYSAGSFPKGEVHPFTLQVTRSHGLSIEGLRSKGWSEFGTPDAPMMDLIITVCDLAASEVYPIWPGNPAMAVWDMPDPAAFEGTYAQKMAAFDATYVAMDARIKLLVAAASFSYFDRPMLKDLAERIARIGAPSN